MNFADIIQGGMTSSVQKKDCCSKNCSLTDSFHSQLAQLMQEGAQISVKQVQVTGTKLSSEDTSLPGNASLKELTERLDYMLDLLFVRNGIPKNPPVVIEYSYTRTEITITGDRDDIEEISRLVNGDDDIRKLAETALTFASHVINMAEGLRFQKEYSESTEPDEVMNKYAFLFDEERHYSHAGFRYGDGLDILSDGKNYSL